MKFELLSASNFLVHLVRLARRNVPESTLQKFHEALIDVLRRRYRDHWFPEKPFKGSGFRCIRINGHFDPLIGSAGEAVGLSPKFLHSIFPSELTLWIDPKEVSYRIGENGSICVLYEHKDDKSEPWRPTFHTNNNNNNTNNKKHTSLQNKNNSRGGGGDTTTTTNNPNVSSPTCKETLRTLDYKSMSIEQLAAFVSS